MCEACLTHRKQSSGGTSENKTCLKNIIQNSEKVSKEMFIKPLFMIIENQTTYSRIVNKIVLYPCNETLLMKSFNDIGDGI